MKPVVLVGAGPRVVLTIARSLRRHGIPSLVALHPGSADWAPSRAVERVVRLPSDAARRGDALVALVRETGASWVVPCTDSALLLLAAEYDRLAALATVGCPRPDVLLGVLDKRATMRVAREAGVPVPAEFDLPDREALRAALPTLPFPLVAKPADKQVSAGPRFKVRHFREAADLVKAFDGDARFGEHLLFQEFCPGEGVGVEVLFDGRDALAVFQHRRLRELPASGGVAVSSVSEAPDPALLAHGVRLLRALRWHGVAMVEFRRDPATGRSVLMEVNGRFWGSLALPVHAGIDFPYWAWQLAHGQAPSVRADYAPGLRMRWGSGDLQRIEERWRAAGGDGGEDGDGGVPVGLGRAVREYLADWRPAVRPALWSWSDPVPAAAEASRALRQLGRTGARRVVRSMVPPSWRGTITMARNLGGTRGAELLRLRVARALGLRRFRLPPATPRAVLFVCHGNIMRSAAAAAMLRARLQQAGYDAPAVLSAGVHVKPGRRAHPNVQALAPEFGIDLADHAAQPLTDVLVAQADLIFTMDDLNAVHVLARHPEARDKVFPLGGIAAGAYCGEEIADPYTGGEAASRQMLQIVQGAVDVLAPLLGIPNRPAPRPEPEPREVAAS